MIGKYLDLHIISEIFSYIYSHHFYFDFSNPILSCCLIANALFVEILDKVLLRPVQLLLLSSGMSKRFGQ